MGEFAEMMLGSGVYWITNVADDRLQARNAELERDARRYRWLRGQVNVDIAACWLVADTVETPEGFDAAIDAALSQEPTRQGQQENNA